MGDYNDLCMNTPGGGLAVAGICHARGENADLPSHWLVYLIVADLDKSLNECVTRGGRALTAVRTMGDTGRYCVIEDPAGAVAALFERAWEEQLYRLRGRSATARVRFLSTFRSRRRLGWGDQPLDLRAACQVLAPARVQSDA
jgi:hypothetical protein